MAINLLKPVDIDLPFQMNEGGYPVTVQGRHTLEASIKSILYTTPGERVYRPTYGSWLRRYLFSNLGTPGLVQAQREIVRAVNQWEPRVTIERIDFTVSNTAVTAAILWKPNGSGQIATTELEFRV